MTGSCPLKPWILFVLTDYHRAKMEPVSARGDTSDNSVQPGKRTQPTVPEMVQRAKEKEILGIPRMPYVGASGKTPGSLSRTLLPC